MALERGYDQRVGASAGPGPVLTSPAAQGAGIGAALEDVGQTAHRAQLQAYQAERQLRADSEAADVAHKLALARTARDQAVIDLRGNAAPGGAGHADAVAKAYDDSVNGILDGVTETRVADHFRKEIDDDRANLLSREMVWQEGKRVGKIADDTDRLIALGFDRISRDPTTWNDELNAAHAAIGAFQNIDADTRAKLVKAADSQYARAYLLNVDPAVGKAMLASGAVNFLDPQEREAIGHAIDANERAQMAQAAREAAVAKAALTDQIQAYEEFDRQGIHVPPAQLAAARDQAMAIGDKSTALKLDGMIANNMFAKIYEGQTPLQIEQHMAALAAKPNPSESDQRELNWLRGHAGSLQAGFERDPVGYAMQYGGPASTPPALNLGDAQSVAARGQWRRAYQQSSGRQIPFFSEAEAAPLREALGRDATGRAQVLGMLDALPDTEKAVAARQLAPNDANFQHEAQLSTGVRAIMFDGRQRLKADPHFMKPDKTDGVNAQTLLNISGSELDFALRAIHGSDIAAIKQSAFEYLAGKFGRAGKSINQLSPADIREAATYALGGRIERGRQLGGIGHKALNGQDRVFVIPDSMSELDFVTAVDRDRQRQDAAGNGPAMDLRLAYPVMIGNGRYRWETAAGRIVTGKKGGAYITDLTR